MARTTTLQVVVRWERTMKDAFGMCINWKVLGGLAAVAVGLFIFAPAYGIAILPLLLFALCPLSMGIMMWTMRGQGGQSCASGEAADTALPQTRVALQERLAAVRDEERELDRQLRNVPATKSAEVQGAE